MFQTVVLNTFSSSTTGKWGISRKYNDTALSCRHSSSYHYPILSFTSQNTLLKTPVWHFPIIFEAVTDIFMLDTNNRSTTPSFLRPHTSINSRYINICKFRDRGTIRVIHKNMVYWVCLKIVWQNISKWVYVYATSCFMRVVFFCIQRT